MKTTRILSAIFFAGVCATVGCNSDSLAEPDINAEHYVGSWRVAVASDNQTFSDYVFGKSGALTHLRSVRDGQTVDVMQGAAAVHASGDALSCAFADEWQVSGLSSIKVGSSCTDGKSREIELSFADTTHATSQVTVASVDGQTGWMKAQAWHFQRCDLSACGE